MVIFCSRVNGFFIVNPQRIFNLRLRPEISGPTIACSSATVPLQGLWLRRQGIIRSPHSEYGGEEIPRDWRVGSPQSSLGALVFRSTRRSASRWRNAVRAFPRFQPHPPPYILQAVEGQSALPAQSVFADRFSRSRRTGRRLLERRPGRRQPRPYPGSAHGPARDDGRGTAGKDFDGVSYLLGKSVRSPAFSRKRLASRNGF